MSNKNVLKTITFLFPVLRNGAWENCALGKRYALVFILLQEETCIEVYSNRCNFYVWYNQMSRIPVM